MRKNMRKMTHSVEIKGVRAFILDAKETCVFVELFTSEIMGRFYYYRVFVALPFITWSIVPS